MKIHFVRSLRLLLVGVLLGQPAAAATSSIAELKPAPSGTAVRGGAILPSQQPPTFIGSSLPSISLSPAASVLTNVRLSAASKGPVSTLAALPILTPAPALAPKLARAAVNERAEPKDDDNHPAMRQLLGAEAAWRKGDPGDASKLASIAPDAASATKPVKLKNQDFGTMFDLTRRVLSRPAARKFLRETFKDALAISPEDQKLFNLPDQIKDVSESQFMLLLGLNPQIWPTIKIYLKEVEKTKGDRPVPEAIVKKWTEKFKNLLADQDILEKFKKLNDPTRAMRLEWPDGRPGYTNQKIYTSHGRMVDGKITKPDNLRQVIQDFVRGAKHEGMFNVFDFDVMTIADEIIASADRGVKWTGGVYLGNLDKEMHPQERAVFDKLKAHKNITMVEVDSVGLNHQKLLIRDWNDKKLAASLLSSGNFTQSDVGPEGDLVDVPMDNRDRVTAESIPNANHLIAMDGYLPAQVIANKLTQTLVYKLRGEDYPLGGAFQIFAPNPTHAADAPNIVISFAPRGTLGDVSRDMIRRLLVETRGPLRLMVFAFSSKTVLDAIVERAKLEKKDGRSLDLKIIEETSFAMRDYSVPLALAGLALGEKDGKKQYVESDTNALRDAMGAAAYEKILPFLRIAPHAYGEHMTADGRKFNAKLHHKVIRSGPYAMLGTSFNPSDNAEHNTEQIVITNDPIFVEPIDQSFEALMAQSPRSIREEAVRRNDNNEVDSDSIDNESKSDDDQARGKSSKK